MRRAATIHTQSWAIHTRVAHAPRHKQLFMEAEWKEIDGILDTASAIETLLETLPPDTKIYETLTLRDVKKCVRMYCTIR